jgi:nucleoside-diphosphate-sugar epimerase
LRYGGFYGSPDDQLLRLVRKRRYPIIGNGEGFTSWVHLDDAAAATVLALEHEGPAIYNIVDDEPAPTRVAPRARERARRKATKARRELGWTLRYPSWRQGFVEVHAKPRTATTDGRSPVPPKVGRASR